MFSMCKQLNGPVLKSLKIKRSGPKSEKKIGVSLTRDKILYFVSAGLGQKFGFLFRTEILIWPGPKFFSLLRAEIAVMRAGPEKSGPCRPLLPAHETYVAIKVQ